MFTGCTGGSTTPGRLPPADELAGRLATALSTGSLAELPLSGDAGAAAADYKAVMARMDGLLPQVSVQSISYQERQATITLAQTWSMGAGSWQYTSTATAQYNEPSWSLDWQPGIIHPQLDSSTRLIHERSGAARGSIFGTGGQPLVWEQPVYRVGINKAWVGADQLTASATRLATLLGINVDNFLAKVNAAGAKAFVVGLTVREGRVPAEIDSIVGGYAQAAALPLAQSSTFAVGLLGGSGEATAEDIADSKGAVAAGDIVGHTGLQAAQDAALRGQAGHTVTLAARPATTSASPSGTASTASSTRPRETNSTEVELFRVDPQDGRTVQTTLDVGLQTKAEQVLSGQPGVASLVVLDSTSGALLAAANSPAAGANSYATTGRYAPGSTFKVSSTLALLRSGLTADSQVSCQSSAVIENTRFTNYSDFPAGRLGAMPLRDAVAYSCNTAFVSSSTRLGRDDLTGAAASLGIGGDFVSGADPGFPVFYGSVPPTDKAVMRATDIIGQGEVEASPLAMAAEAASVHAGHTVIPYLIADQVPTSTATPLSSSEVDQLRQAMSAVVEKGSGRAMRGYVQAAKTGTAEFASNGQTLAHAWMIAYTDSYAIAAFVEVGESGSGTAGPIIRSFLS